MMLHKTRLACHGARLVRAGLALALALPLAASAAATVSVATATAAADDARTELVYVGSQGDQLHALRFDPASGALALIGPVADGLRPTWTLPHPRLPVLYAPDNDNAREGSVSAYAVDRASGALTKINQVAAGGKGTTHLWLDAPSNTLLVANFASGSASSIALKADGGLGALVSTIQATGSGPHRRQAGPHAHSVAVDPSGRYALVPDLGADRVFVYGLDRASHALAPDDGAAPRSFIAPAGSGPRHLVFSADGRVAYLLAELTAQVMTLRWDAERGRLALAQTLAVGSADFAGTPSVSELALGADGRLLYVANRAENSVVSYRVDAGTGELALAARAPSGGDGPWGFALHPSGKWMLVAHQRGGTVNVLRIDPASGALSDTGQAVALPTPVSIGIME